jgi:hypothetical protein
MNRTHWFRHVTRLSLLMLFAALVVATTSSAAVSGGLSLQLCGSVSGAVWKFQGQTGTQYNVSSLPEGSCAVAMKSVSALTKQKPRAGVLGPHSLAGPSGFHCSLTGIPFILLAHAGFCTRGGHRFFWAPRLKK